MDGDVQSCGLSRSVLTVREKASSTFAVLDVGASRLFEQPKAREHEGRSSNAFRVSPQPTIEGRGWRVQLVGFRITDAFAGWALCEIRLDSPPPHLCLMATKRKTEQRARAGSIKGELERIESVFLSFSPLYTGKIVDSLRQDRSSSSSYRSLPDPNVKSVVTPVNFTLTKHIDRPFDTPNGTPPMSPTTQKPQGEEGFWSDLKTLRWAVRPCTHLSQHPPCISSPLT